MSTTASELQAFAEQAIEMRWDIIDGPYAIAGQVMMENPRVEDAYGMRHWLKQNLVPLILQVACTKEEVVTASRLVLEQASIRSAGGTVGDHHAIDYGEAITYYFFNMAPVSALAADGERLRRLIDEKKVAAQQPAEKPA